MGGTRFKGSQRTQMGQNPPDEETGQEPTQIEKDKMAEMIVVAPEPRTKDMGEAGMDEKIGVRDL